jgi:hypothetical protein
MIAAEKIEKPWSKGTDLRNDKGIYCWPHMVYDSANREYFPSVTHVLDLVQGDMKFAEFWFIAEYVDHVVKCAKQKMTVLCWDPETKETIERSAIEVLQDKHWMKGAGGREMTRRANRGTVIHDAIEDWALNGMRVDPDDIDAYTFQLIQANEFAIPADYCSAYVRTALEWCNNHVVEILMSESPVFNRTLNYAGTLDLVCRIKGLDGVTEDETWLIDAKGSKGPQPTHPIQNACYANAEFVGIKGTNQMVPFEKPQRFANLYIQEDKATLREWKKEPEAFKAFQHLRMVWQYLVGKDLPVTVKAPKVKTPTKDQLAIPGV